MQRINLFPNPDLQPGGRKPDFAGLATYDMPVLIQRAIHDTASMVCDTWIIVLHYRRLANTAVIGIKQIRWESLSSLLTRLVVVA